MWFKHALFSFLQVTTAKEGHLSHQWVLQNRYRAELPAFETATTGISVIHGCPRQMSISIRASTMPEQ